MTRIFVRLHRLNPTRLVVLGYLAYVIVGWILLSLPVMWESGARVTGLDALFISTSAVSTTGLVTVNTPLVFSFWGELVVLLLIQAGGLGYMTLGSFVVLAGAKKLSETREGIVRTTFALPEGFKPGQFVRRVVVFTLLVEAVGSILLFPGFLSAAVAERAEVGEIGASFSGYLHVAWQSIFHSVSAFCTAGFSLFPDSLETYSANVWINAVISALSLLGAVGFIVLTDAFRAATSNSYRITLTSKIILHITSWFVIGGAVLLYFGDPSMSELRAEQRVLVAFFQSMSSATTVGFNTYPIGQLGLASVFLMYLLMIVGASPSGTGGGLKSTSVSAMIATVRSLLKGRREVTFFGRQIPRERLATAFAALTMYVATLIVGGYLLLLTETRGPAPSLGDQSWSFESIVFEAASALGTVGLSRGMTPDLTGLGKIIIIFLMFAGRLGPMTLGLALFAFDHREDSGQEDVAI